MQSAEVRSGVNTYDDSVNPDHTGVKAIGFDTPDTLTYGGSFSPTERLHFADPRGFVAAPRSGLSNVTTTRTFEAVLLDTNVKPTGEVETGATDDFGIIIRVGDVEDGSPVTDEELVFLSFTGGLQGADIDTLQVPPGRDVIVNFIYLDLDNLHDVLKIKTIKDIYLIDGSGSGDVEIIEVFNLNPPGGGRDPGDLNCDGSVDLVDVGPFITALLDPQRYNNEYPDCDINNADINEDGSIDLVDVGPFIELLIGP